MENISARWSFGDGFQYQVLGLCLRDPKFLAQYADVIQYSYFDNQSLSQIAFILLGHFKKSGEPPTRDVLECLIHEYAKTYDRDGSKGLESNLQNHLNYIYDRHLDAEFISSRIRKFGQRQAVQRALFECADFLQASETNRDVEGDNLVENVSKTIESACQTGLQQSKGLWWHDIALILPQMFRDSITQKTKVPTNLPRLDDCLSGGIGAGELGVIMGAPNMGKSTLLTCLGVHAQYYLAAHAPEGETPPAVVHITCEMSDLATFLKYASSSSCLTINDVKHGNDEKYAKQVSPQLPRQAPLHIKYFIPGTVSAEEIKWYIANIVMTQNIKIGMVILDYADRLRGGEDDRFAGMGRIYDQLIEISKKFECPVWTGCQVRRTNARDEIIDAQGAAESWKKVEAADVIISLNQKDLEAAQKIMRLGLVKVRDGEAGGLVWTKFDKACVSLRELSDQEFEELKSQATSGNQAPGSLATPYRKRTRPPGMPQAMSEETLVSDLQEAKSRYGE